MNRRLRVLISAYACEPYKGSEPEVGWQWALQMARFHDVTVVTRSNNRPGIEQGLRDLPPGTPHPQFLYYDLKPLWLALKKRLRTHRIYYYFWQRGVRSLIAGAHRREPFELLHHLTFAAYRYPAAIWGHGIPAIWGPIGGMESISRHLLPRRDLAGAAYEIVRNLSNTLESTCSNRLSRRARDSAAVLVSTRETEAAFARHGIATHLFPTIGIERRLISSEALTPPQGPLRFLFVGGLVPLKGIDLALEALALSKTDATLTLFGEGPARKDLEKLVATLKLDGRVRFEGRQPRAAVLAAYGSYHVFLFPGLHDSGGFAVIEAMAQGLPVICLDCGGPALSVGPHCGIRVPVKTRQETVAGLAKAMEFYHRSRENVAEHGRTAREKVLQDYEWNRQGDRMNALYDAVNRGEGMLGTQPGLAWKSLFGGGSRDCEVRFLRKGGRPFLFLPAESAAACAALALYPAQRPAARLLKTLLAAGLQWRLPFPLPSLPLAVDPAAPFVRFMAGLVGQPPGTLPVWGMLAGNPNAPGQRLVFLVFDGDFKPRAVVKTGLGETARRLIAQEIGALAALPPGLAGAPGLLGQWGDGSAAALALPYVGGEAPLPQSIGPAAAILEDWLRHGSDAPLDSLPGWRAATASLPASELLPLSTPHATVRAPVAHGDFAPWNIKVSPETGGWTVLDWERGELCGVPGWDWFHFVLQPAVLVEKLDGPALAARAGELLASPEFRHYAEAAGIVGCERPLLLAYLAHCTEVIRQTEGASALAAARTLLRQQWG